VYLVRVAAGQSQSKRLKLIAFEQFGQLIGHHLAVSDNL